MKKGLVNFSASSVPSFPPTVTVMQKDAPANMLQIKYCKHDVGDLFPDKNQTNRG